MNEYDREKMQKMQQDAEHRLREMQRRADRAVSGNDMPPVPNFVTLNNNRQQNNHSNNGRHAPDKHKTTEAQNGQQALNGKQSAGGYNVKTESAPNHSVKYIPPEPKATGGILGKLKGLDILKAFNFKNFKIDSDISLIIALIFLLSTEEADELLLLALVYIML